MRFNSRLPQIATSIDAAVKEAIRETAVFILVLVKIYCPVDTGALQKSYTFQEAEGLKLLIGSALLYSIFVEFGTSNPNYPVQPHLVPAFLQAEWYFRQRVIFHVNALARN